MNSRLGQHFLKDKKTLEKIVDTLDIKNSDIIIEIGPGHGELTNHIISRNPKKLIAIEKDKELANKVKCLPANNLEVIEGDALKLLPNISDKLQTSHYKLIGNIPYYITGRLMRILSELKTKPELIVLTIQKEVAMRICSEPPKMNLLAASVQFWAKPEIIKIIDRKLFSPSPEVDSAIIKITTKNKSKIKDENNYYKLIKVLFKQPRKTVLNNLAAGLKLSKEEVAKILTKQGIKPDVRPQNLSIEDVFNLNEFH